MPPSDLVVIDEAHHARAQSYRRVTEHYAGVPIVGLTATPFRLDGRGLGDVFGSIGGVVETWLRLGRGRRTVVFAVNIAHSRLLTEAFRRKAVPAEHLDGGTSRVQRDAILYRLRGGS